MLLAISDMVAAGTVGSLALNCQMMPRTRQTIDAVICTLAATYSPTHVIPAHSHDWHQLLYASEGVMTFHTSVGSWVVPPHRAAWIPAGVIHSVEMSGSVTMRTLYLLPGISKALPQECCTVNVPPLLRELILDAVGRQMLHRSVPREARLIRVILDQIEALPVAPLQLPMPRDARALKVAGFFKSNPSEPKSLDQIARQ